MKNVSINSLTFLSVLKAGRVFDSFKDGLGWWTADNDNKTTQYNYVRRPSHPLPLYGLSNFLWKISCIPFIFFKLYCSLVTDVLNNVWIQLNVLIIRCPYEPHQIKPHFEKRVLLLRFKWEISNFTFFVNCTPSVNWVKRTWESTSLVPQVS